MADKTKRLRTLLDDLERQKPTLLIVDDNENCFELLALLLRGCDVVWAKDAEEALHILELNPERFDVVMIDEIMPRMPGHELCQVIRDKWPEMKVALVTGFEFSEEAKHKIRNLGVLFMISKPVNEAVLDTFLEWVLR